jgi:hypothetical protein
MENEIVDGIQNKMEERTEELLNKSEAHLRSRVAGLKSILENNKGNKKLLAALKPLMKNNRIPQGHQSCIRGCGQFDGFQSSPRREQRSGRSAET